MSKDNPYNAPWSCQEERIDGEKEMVVRDKDGHLVAKVYGGRGKLVALTPQLLKALAALAEEECFVDVDTCIGPLPEPTKAYQNALKLIAQAHERQ